MWEKKEILIWRGENEIEKVKCGEIAGNLFAIMEMFGNSDSLFTFIV